MTKLKYHIQSVETHKNKLTGEEREITILGRHRNEVCKECGKEPKQQGSSRGIICSNKHKVILKADLQIELSRKRFEAEKNNKNN